MRKNKFISSLTWELKNLFRFPLPGVLLAVFTYMIFLPRGGGYAFTVSPENIVWEEITRNISFHAIYRAARFSFYVYVPMGIFASIFATLVFAYEIENGVLKAHLSHPISRRSIFLSKLSSCFLIVFTTFSASLLAHAFLQDTKNAFYVILSTDLLLRLLLTVALQSLFMVSIAVSFSLYTGKTSVSLVGSFATISLIQLLGESADLKFLPPTSFRELASFLFTPTPKFSQFSNFAAIPITSAFLIIFSYLFFSRRLEIG